MSAHTPGPWVVGTDGRIRSQFDGSAVAETFWNTTARAAGAKANAELIAAAPELLDALRALVEANHALLAQVDALAVAVPLRFIPVAQAVADAEIAIAKVRS